MKDTTPIGEINDAIDEAIAFVRENDPRTGPSRAVAIVHPLEERLLKTKRTLGFVPSCVMQSFLWYNTNVSDDDQIEGTRNGSLPMHPDYEAKTLATLRRDVVRFLGELDPGRFDQYVANAWNRYAVEAFKRVTRTQ